jgi:hypothetical protein
LQQRYFNKPIRPRALGNRIEFQFKRMERVMLDLVVTHWFRVVSALIGGPAGLKAAEDARRVAEARVAEDARRDTNLAQRLEPEIMVCCDALRVIANLHS